MKIKEFKAILKADGSELGYIILNKHLVYYSDGSFCYYILHTLGLMLYSFLCLLFVWKIYLLRVYNSQAIRREISRIAGTGSIYLESF